MHHNRKGGARVARQNFSMHPDLVRDIIRVTNHLNHERVEEILRNRQRRVTYSKVVAALTWLLQTRYLTPEGEPTDDLRQLLRAYEATPYEQPDPYEPHHTGGDEKGEEESGLDALATLQEAPAQGVRDELPALE